MADFDQAISTIIAHEGGYVNDPDDPGGATKYGISLRWLKSLGEDVGDFDGDGEVTVQDIVQMSQEDAEHLYRVQWWDKYQYSQIKDQDIATKVFDLAVNMGARQAHKLIQRACRACGDEIADDGILGQKTLASINSVNAHMLMASVRSEAAGYYRLISAIHTHLKKFLPGWLKRAYD